MGTGWPAVKRTTAFTLIELLVVISIIALLIALLLPALKKAKEVALQTQCAANLHEMFIGLSAYAMDYDDKFPRPTENVGPSNTEPVAAEQLANYYGWLFDATICPTLDIDLLDPAGNPRWGDARHTGMANWHFGYLNIFSLQSGGHAGYPVEPPQVPYAPKGMSDPPDYNVSSDHVFRAWHSWLDWGYDRTAHKAVSGRPTGSNNSFLDGSVVWFHRDVLGPEGKGIDTTVGNYDYFGKEGFRSYFWGVSQFR